MFFGYIILMVLCIAHYFLLCGYLYTYGTTLTAVITEFGSTMTMGAAARTAYTLVSAMLAIVVGWVISKRSAKLCLIIGSVSGIITSLLLIFVVNSMNAYFFTLAVPTAMMTAFGSGIAAQTIISKWFQRRRSVCLAILNASGGLAGFTMPGITAWLMEKTGDWRTVWVLVLMGSILCLVLSIFILCDSPVKKGLYPDGIVPKEPEKQIKEAVKAEALKKTDMLRSKVFLITLLAFAGSNFSLNAVTGYSVATFMDKGLSLVEASKVLSIYAFVNFFTRLLSGVAMDRFNPKYVSPVSMFSIASACAIVPFATSKVGAYLFAVIFGFGYGFTTIGPQSIFLRAYGVRNFSSIYSFEVMLTGFISTALSIFPGIIRDMSNSFDLLYIVIAVMTLTGGMALLKLNIQKQEG